MMGQGIAFRLGRSKETLAMHRDAHHPLGAGAPRLLILVLLAALTLGLLPPPVAYAAIIVYVNDNATGANNGASWANAYTSLQTAIANAFSSTEIWVAAGTYTPGTLRTDTFTLKNTTAIYGGFAGTETLRSQRNIAANPTILSGDIGAVGSNADNSYHVVSGVGTNNTAVLDGFTITSGNTRGASN